MNIEEAVQKAMQQMLENEVLAAKPPFTWGAEAKFVKLMDDYRVPQDVLDAGYQYLLGRDDLLSLLLFLKGKAVSHKTVAEFIIHYALNDGPPTWIDDIPNI